MREYRITTDNMCDLSNEYVAEHQILRLWLPYMMDNVTYAEGESLPYPEFYQKMRDGSMPTTSQVNPQRAREEFEKLIKEGYDILHIAFSSGLSGSYNSARIAANELLEEYPEAKIYVVDSLAAALGQGLLVCKAVAMKENNASIEEVYDWLEKYKLNVCHVLTVDDLNHLYRGGRVSKTTAFIGTLANIKPILYINEEGKLIPLSKVRGRKKSIQTLITLMEERMKSMREQNDVIYISHGDCIEDALYLKRLIEEKFDIHNFMIEYVGPTIGAHSGPGTLAVFFMGEIR